MDAAPGQMDADESARIGLDADCDLVAALTAGGAMSSLIWLALLFTAARGVPLMRRLTVGWLAELDAFECVHCGGPCRGLGVNAWAGRRGQPAGARAERLVMPVGAADHVGR
jgi:hypothetical protein